MNNDLRCHNELCAWMLLHLKRLNGVPVYANRHIRSELVVDAMCRSHHPLSIDEGASAETNPTPRVVHSCNEGIGKRHSLLAADDKAPMTRHAEKIAHAL